MESAQIPQLIRIGLGNFLAFEHVELELAPLTVLIGANSTGKSAVLHALVLLKQSLEGGDYRVPLTFGGPLLDLGRLQDVRWGRRNRALRFHLMWENGCGIATSIKPQRRIGLAVQRDTFRLIAGGREWRLDAGDKVEPWYFSFEITQASEREKIFAFRETNATVKQFFTALRYVGPLRQPTREAYFGHEQPGSVGPQAHHLIPFLIEHRDVVQRISSWLRKHHLADGIEVRETLKGSGRWGIYVVENRAKRVRWNLVDTGFGYSQLIPVLAELYGSVPGSLTLIEQPEIHLNPRLAIAVGDLLIETIKAGKHVLVETHSEHLVLRLRRRIAEGDISRDQVAIYFVRRSRQESKSFVERITLNEVGQLKGGWPDQFWHEDYEETFAMFRALIERQRARDTGG